MWACIVSVGLLLLVFGLTSRGSLGTPQAEVSAQQRTIEAHLAEMSKLKNCGFAPANILDVGAGNGAWAKAMYSLYPEAHYFLIEGNKAHTQALRALRHSNIKYDYQLAVVSRTAQHNVTFYHNEDGTQTLIPRVDGKNGQLGKEGKASIDSVTAAAAAAAAAAATTTTTTTTTPTANSELVSTTTIDRILSKRYGASTSLVQQYSLAKFDLHGGERMAIRGALSVLKHAEVILVEATVLGNYPRANPHSLIVEYLQKYGFYLYNLIDITRDTNNYVTNMDSVLIHGKSKLWDMKCTGYPKPLYLNYTHTSKNTSVGGENRSASSSLGRTPSQSRRSRRNKVLE